jgi:hypothetical protein
MEDNLDLYAEPYDQRYPLVCFDEKLYQMVSETRQPLPVPQASRCGTTMNITGRGPATCSCALSPSVAGAMWRSQIVAQLKTLLFV